MPTIGGDEMTETSPTSLTGECVKTLTGRERWTASGHGGKKTDKNAGELNRREKCLFKCDADDHSYIEVACPVMLLRCTEQTFSRT